MAAIVPSSAMPESIEGKIVTGQKHRPFKCGRGKFTTTATTLTIPPIFGTAGVACVQIDNGTAADASTRYYSVGADGTVTITRSAGTASAAEISYFIVYF